MKRNFLTKMATALLAVGLIACSEKPQPIVFETCEFEGGDNCMVEIDIPQGNSEKDQNVIKGIREIIAQSKLSKEVGKPLDGTIQEIIEDYYERYNKYAEEYVRQSDSPHAPMCNLTIKSCFQNEACVTFLVFDGIHFMGSSDYYQSIVRLSDGHVVAQQELVNISISDAKKLIEKYYKDDIMPVYLEDGYWFSPFSGDSCHVMWAAYRNGWGETTIPLSEMDPYLTEEGKKLFSAKAFDVPSKDSDTPDEEDEPVSSVSNDFTVLGELGIFDLHGAVKEYVWSDGNETFTRSFDEKGMWISENRKKPWDDSDIVKRDDLGRIIKMGDPYDERYETFDYNDDGLITKRIMKDIDGYTVQTKYSYNDEKECIKTISTVDDPLEGPGEYTNTYTILERDSQGNWTKRKSQNDYTETRKITYY